MKLSVIVPSYNVSNYLEECIDSILTQEIESMEILIVNDGSTDNTLDLAKHLEKREPSIRVIDQPNGGLGNARNTGSRHATGEYITFVDSDDVVTEGAFEEMLQTIEKSGSDFVIGNVIRFNSTREYPSVLHQKVFHNDLVGVNIKNHPELVYDTTAWNKIYRRNFWDKHQFVFPEKMLFEDIPVTIPAHAVAEKVDVLTRVIYKWRSRDVSNPSITQQNSNIQNFIDRTKAFDLVREFFKRESIHKEVQNTFDYKILAHDIPLYFPYLLENDEEYRNAIETYIQSFIPLVDSSVTTKISFIKKTIYKKILSNQLEGWVNKVGRNRLKRAFFLLRNTKRILREYSPQKILFEVTRKFFYPILMLLPIKKNLCVFESFWGREFSDNPKAIYDYIRKNHEDIETVIAVEHPELLNDLQDKKTKVVKYQSWQYFYFLARAKHLFNNVNFPDNYRKRKGAIEVQTMHGTPLKKLGLDNPEEVPPSKVKKFVQKAKRWDYLTVPSDYVGKVAKSAFRFENNVLNVGYPRNDALFQTNKSLQKELREKYHLPLDKKILLYAPTWRIKGKYSLQMDVHEMKKDLGHEYILVVKLHHFMTQNFSTDGVEDFLFVFQEKAEVSDFYHIADCLITDYSSVMFDYALMNRPMIFFTYDYENYKNSLRGMYFDFANEAPGPMVDTTEQLIQEIQEIDTNFTRFEENIRAFHLKYNQYDNGNACEQLVKEVIGK